MGIVPKRVWYRLQGNCREPKHRHTVCFDQPKEGWTPAHCLSHFRIRRGSWCEPRRQSGPRPGVSASSTCCKIGVVCIFQISRGFATLRPSIHLFFGDPQSPGKAPTSSSALVVQTHLVRTGLRARNRFRRRTCHICHLPPGTSHAVAANTPLNTGRGGNSPPLVCCRDSFPSENRKNKTGSTAANAGNNQESSPKLYQKVVL